MTNLELEKIVKTVTEEMNEVKAENEELKSTVKVIEDLTNKLKAIEAQLTGEPRFIPVTNDVIDEAAQKDIDNYLNEKIPVKFFKDNEQYKDDIITIYRGLVYNIKRGIATEIPRGLAFALEDAEAQNQRATFAMEKFEEAYSKSMAHLS